MEREILVNLNLIEEAQAFCKLAEKTAADVKLCSGEYIVNGKSLMGLFSLNLSKPITVRVNGSAEEVNKFVDQIISTIKNAKA